MARRTSPPFRADHVGSLLRPPALHRARADFAAPLRSPPGKLVVLGRGHAIQDPGPRVGR